MMKHTRDKVIKMTITQTLKNIPGKIGGYWNIWNKVKKFGKLFQFAKKAKSVSEKAQKKVLRNMDCISDPNCSDEEADAAARNFYRDLYIEPTVELTTSAIEIVY